MKKWYEIILFLKVFVTSVKLYTNIKHVWYIDVCRNAWFFSLCLHLCRVVHIYLFIYFPCKQSSILFTLRYIWTHLLVKSEQYCSFYVEHKLYQHLYQYYCYLFTSNNSIYLNTGYFFFYEIEYMKLMKVLDLIYIIHVWDILISNKGLFVITHHHIHNVKLIIINIEILFEQIIRYFCEILYKYQTYLKYISHTKNSQYWSLFTRWDHSLTLIIDNIPSVKK